MNATCCEAGLRDVSESVGECSVPHAGFAAAQDDIGRHWRFTETDGGRLYRSALDSLVREMLLRVRSRGSCRFSTTCRLDEQRHSGAHGVSADGRIEEDEGGSGGFHEQVRDAVGQKLSTQRA